MLDNLIFSLNAVMPIFLVMVIGFFIKRAGFFDNAGARQMNALVFNFALPIKLFMDIFKSDMNEMMDIPLILYSVSTNIIWFFLIWALALYIIKDRNHLGAFIQGCFRSNYAIIGLPLVANILDGHLPGKAAVISTFVIPLYNIMAVIVLTIYGNNKEIEIKSSVKSALRNIARNPMIIGILLGVIFSGLKIPLPKPAVSSLNYMAELSTPLALICIGGSIDLSKVKARFKPALIVCFLKLALMPLLFIPPAIMLGLPSDSIIILFVLFAAPTAVSSYVMVTYMGSDEALASNILVMTSLFSVFTYTIGVYVLKSIGII